MVSARLDQLLGFEHGLPPEYGLALALAGGLFLFLGWRLQRVTVVVGGFLIGAFCGQLVARHLDVGPAWGVLAGGGALALLADPLYRVLVFVLGGLALGSALGEGVRLLAPGGFLWGFFPGFFAGGALSVWKIRLVVIFSTAFLGALIFCWGLALVLCAWALPLACDFNSLHPLLTRVLLGLAFVGGCVVQLRSSGPGEKKAA